MKRKIFNNIIFFLIIILCFSCKKVTITNSKLAYSEEFKREQVMILVAEEKNRFENRFGKEVWNLKSGNGKSDFKEYVLNNVKLYVEKLMTLKLMANDYGIVVSQKDIQNLSSLAEKYLKNMNVADEAFIGCSYEDVLNMYIDYHLSRLVVDSLLNGTIDEISVAESKVISAQYIIVSDYDKAKEVREKLNLKGASFSYYAKKESIIDDIDILIKKGDELSNAFPEVFNLEKGKISDVLKGSDGKYYIFKCINDYMEEETMERKKEIVKSLKNSEFESRYEEYAKNHIIHSTASYWKTIDISKGENCTINCFFDLYDEIF